MKSLRWLLLPILLSLGSCPELAVFPADAPKASVAVVKTTKQATVPQVLLDLLEKVEADRLSIIVAQTQIVIAQQSLDSATKDKATATAAMGTDQAAFLAKWAELYGPVEPPKPPDPPQPPNPVVGPIRVLFLYESGDLTKLPPAQVAILTSLKVRAYLNAHCPKESACTDGSCPANAPATPTPCYRFLDKDADTAKMSVSWQNAVGYLKGKLPTPFVPTLLICDTAGPVFDGPWPQNETDLLALLAKWGGN